MMNWSAKDGARSSPHYGGEGVSIHPSHQGVCRRREIPGYKLSIERSYSRHVNLGRLLCDRKL